MTKLTEDAERLLGIYEALDEVHTAWTRYTGAKTVVEQADRLTTLESRMSDLATWHPDYDMMTGLIG